MLRSVIPRISAACHHMICFTIARKISSWTFIARSTAASKHCFILHPCQAGRFTQDRLMRTDHLLIEPDIRCANDTPRRNI